jgi:uncharacterized protein YaaQ
MKMILAIIRADDARTVVEALTVANYRVTKIATEGAWLRKENTTLLIGVQDNQIEHALNLLKRVGGKRKGTQLFQGDLAVGIPPEEVEIEVGGVTAFVVDVNQFIQM